MAQLHFQTEQFTLASFFMEWKMVMANKFGKMDQSMMASGNTTKPMVKEL